MRQYFPNIVVFYHFYTNEVKTTGMNVLRHMSLVMVSLWCQISHTSITVAALCNAHVFESAHPQSYVIAHKLL